MSDCHFALVSLLSRSLLKGPMHNAMRELLEKLQVADLMPGQEWALALPADTVAQGRGVSAALTVAMLVAGQAAPDFTDAGGRGPQRVGVCQGHPSVVRVIDESNAPLEPRSLTGEGVGVSEGDPSTVFADFDAAGNAVVLRRGEGDSVLIQLEDGRLLVTDLLPARLEVPPLAEVSAPLAEWAAVCEDEWLAGELRARADVGGAWQSAVGAGMCARLQEVGSPAARREIVRAILAGRPRDAGTAPRRWARQLSHEQVQTIEDLLVAVVDRVEASLDDLEDSMLPGEAWWRDALVQVCLDRDDLECARLILAERGEADRVGPTLDALDALGRRFMRSIPIVFELPGEQLRRAALADPEAWWASLEQA